MATNLLVAFAAACKHVSPVQGFGKFVIEVERYCDWKRLEMPSHNVLVSIWENA